MLTTAPQTPDQKLLITIKELRAELISSNMRLVKTINEASIRMVHQNKICADLERTMEEINVS